MTEKLIRMDRRARGKCENCSKRPPKDGCTWCVVCRRLQQLTIHDLYDERRQRRLCPYCGRPSAPSSIMCRGCQRRCRERRAKQRASQ